MARSGMLLHKPSVLETGVHQMECKLTLEFSALAASKNVDIRYNAGTALKSILPESAAIVLTESKPSDIDTFMRYQDIPKLGLGAPTDNYLQDDKPHQKLSGVRRIYFSPFQSYAVPFRRQVDIFTPGTGTGPIALPESEFERYETVEVDGRVIRTMGYDVLLAINLTHLVVIDGVEGGEATKGSQRLVKAVLLAGYIAERRGMNYLTDVVLAETGRKLVESKQVVAQAVSRVEANPSLKDKLTEQVKRDRAPEDTSSFEAAFDTYLPEYKEYERFLSTYTSGVIAVNSNKLLSSLRRAEIGDDRNNERVLRRLEKTFRQTSVEKHEQ